MPQQITKRNHLAGHFQPKWFDGTGEFATPWRMVRFLPVGLVVAIWFAPSVSRAQTSYGQISPPAVIAAPSALPAPTSVQRPTSSSPNGETADNPENAAPLPVPGNGTPLGETRRFKYAFSFNTSVTYDDNIFIQQKKKVSDLVVLLQPVMTVGWGDALEQGGNFLRLDYTPSIFFFTNNDRQSSVDHSVHLAGQYVFPKLTADISQSVQILSGSDRDVGDRTTRNIYTTDVAVNYPLTGKTSLNLGVSYNINDYATLISSESSAVTFGVGYAYDPKLSIGMSSTAGYTTVSGTSPSQTFEQISFNASYQISGKVSLDISVGGELSQYEGRDGSRLSPIFRLSGSYKPFDGTLVSISGHRSDQPSSSFVSENYSTTGISINISQRLLTRFTAGFGIGYENSDYFGTGSGTSSGRQDNYYFFSPTLDVQIKSYASAGIYYTNRRNDSSVSTTSFVDNQVGLHFVINF